MKNKIISTPLTIAALLIIILVGVYLVLVIKQSNKATESDTANITNQTPADISDTSVTPDSSDTSGTTDNSDSSDETANWQTYTSDQYGFSFKYPKAWEINKNAQSNNQELLVAFNVRNYGVAGNSFTIYRSIAKIGMVPNTTIGGKKAAKGNRLQGVESQGQSVTIQLDDGSYIKIFVKGSALDDLDQILSTFKFTP